MSNTAKLWSAAKAMFERMRAAIGDAAALARRDWIGPKEQREIRAWLGPIIAMARKIVFIEAAALPRCAPPPAAKRAATRAKSPRPRTISIRLWPQQKRIGPRARQLGPPVLVRDIWRDRAREAAARHLAMVRFMRPTPHLQLSRRIEALARLIARPLAAARRLARKLRLMPRIAIKIGAALLPRTRLYDCPEYDTA
ncbi:MAG TPA: hypothetical protein VEF55_11645, partial [Candidatus Binatia bacterium]|nr:hypothetical protein [Candidatus Binatia bacterium]